MPVVGFKPGDFVEFDSNGNTKWVFKGVLTHIGWLGEEPKQPRQVAFVDVRDGRRPFYVAASRLRPSSGYALWTTKEGGNVA